VLENRGQLAFFVATSARYASDKDKTKILDFVFIYYYHAFFKEKEMQDHLIKPSLQEFLRNHFGPKVFSQKK